MISGLTIPEGHDDSVFIVSTSGGKDSTATLLAMREAGIPHRAVFADTGWEAPETYEYLATLERLLGITIDRVRSEKGGMVDIARHKAGFPTRRGKWCTEELKLKPLRAYHDRVAEDADAETVSVIGIRADESAARAAMRAFEYSDLWGGYVWRPILAWSVADVLAMHHRHGVPIHPHYFRGHERVGCWPCINSRKESVRLIARDDPARIDEIHGYEAEFTAERARRNQSGEGSFEYPQATFFMPVTPGVPNGIRDVVAWSRTKRGGCNSI
jgi:3'-phosphoadenosine 5'-phosphosulfate sulfotransferase (PAPS reductase)/FAD synthetase